MKLKELTFCSASIIMKVNPNELTKLIEGIDGLDINEITIDNSNLKTSLFFTIQDLLELKDTEKSFMILNQLILAEEKKLSKLFKTIESFNNIQNINRYFCKNDNMELKFLALCHYYLKLNQFKDFTSEDSSVINKLLSDLYIKLSREIMTESFKLLVALNSDFSDSGNNVDYEKISKSLYNDLKNVKESNTSLTLENKTLSKLNKTYIKQIDKLNKEILDSKDYIKDNIQKTMEENNKILIDTFKHLKYDVLDNTYNSSLDKLINELSQSKADNKILLQ